MVEWGPLTWEGVLTPYSLPYTHAQREFGIEGGCPWRQADTRRQIISRGDRVTESHMRGTLIIHTQAQISTAILVKNRNRHTENGTNTVTH